MVTRVEACRYVPLVPSSQDCADEKALASSPSTRSIWTLDHPNVELDNHYGFVLVHNSPSPHSKTIC